MEGVREEGEGKGSRDVREGRKGKIEGERESDGGEEWYS